MPERIVISPDLMRDRAEEYRDQAELLDDILRQLDGLLNALRYEWEGAASEAYASKYGELRPNFIQTSDLTREIARSLEKVAQDMFEVDHKLARWL